MIAAIIITIIVILLTIVFHEAGHIITYIHIKGKEPEIFLSWREIHIGYEDTSLAEHIMIILVGIVLGFVPIALINTYLYIPYWLNMFILISYIAGCTFDLTEILKSLRLLRRGFI